MKIIKIESCMYCDTYFRFKQKRKEFTCSHPDFANYQDSYRIINRQTAINGGVSNWCPLEDFIFEKEMKKNGRE